MLRIVVLLLTEGDQVGWRGGGGREGGRARWASRAVWHRWRLDQKRQPARQKGATVEKRRSEQGRDVCPCNKQVRPERGMWSLARKARDPVVSPPSGRD